MIIGRIIADDQFAGVFDEGERFSIADEVVGTIAGFDGVAEQEDDIFIYWDLSGYESAGSHLVYLTVQILTQAGKQALNQQVPTQHGLEELAQHLLECMQAAFAADPEQRVGVLVASAQHQVWVDGYPTT